MTTPQDVAMATICKEINFCRKMKLNIIGIVENMSEFVCPCCQVRHCTHTTLTDRFIAAIPLFEGFQYVLCNLLLGVHTSFLGLVKSFT